MEYKMKKYPSTSLPITDCSFHPSTPLRRTSYRVDNVCIKENKFRLNTHVTLSGVEVFKRLSYLSSPHYAQIFFESQLRMTVSLSGSDSYRNEDNFS